jgi:hypothetical protein
MHYNLTRRLIKLESAIAAKQDLSLTLEELCRRLWQENKEGFFKVSKLTSFSFFVAQFEREDAERKETDALRNRRAGMATDIVE